jgi:hypothetical protein
MRSSLAQSYVTGHQLTGLGSMRVGDSVKWVQVKMGLTVHASWQEITDLMVVKDSMLDGRVRLFLGVDEKGHSHSAPEGILANLFKREICNYLRRFTFVRIVLAVAQSYPQVSHPLGHPLLVISNLWGRRILPWLLQIIGDAAAVAWRCVLHDESIHNRVPHLHELQHCLCNDKALSCAAPSGHQCLRPEGGLLSF